MGRVTSRNQFAAFVSRVEAGAGVAVRETCEEIAVRAGDLAPKDTTSLSLSYYAQTGTESNYADVAAAAAAVNPKAVILPELPAPPDALHGRTVSAVSHAAAQELGYTNEAGKTLPAQPHLGPAAETERDRFTERLERVVREAAR